MLYNVCRYNRNLFWWFEEKLDVFLFINLYVKEHVYNLLSFITQYYTYI